MLEPPDIIHDKNKNVNNTYVSELYYIQSMLEYDNKYI